MKEKTTAVASTIRLRSAWKGLFKTFIATTISIVLTFGTAALIDKNKNAKERRQIVLMIMYDLNNSLVQARHCDSIIQGFVETQTRVIQDTACLDEYTFRLVTAIPIMNYTETIESIFSSNVETIHTIGNVHFVEKASEFYQLRKKYKDNVDDFNNEQELLEIPISCEWLADFDAFHHFVKSSYLLAEMEYYYMQCKQIMNVTDKEMESFYSVRKKIEAESVDKENVFETRIPQLQQKWQEALEKRNGQNQRFN